MRDKWFGTQLFVALLFVPNLGLSQPPAQNGTFTVSGYPGQVPVVKINGKSYVEIESLARLTNSTMSFRANHITLTLSSTSANTPKADDPAKTGLSRAFRSASIEELTALGEWRATVANAILRNYPETEDSLAGYRRAAQNKLALASAAAATESDQKGVSLLNVAFGIMQRLNDNYLATRKSMTYVRPDSMDNDPLNQQLLNCARGLESLAAGSEFQDVPACH